MKQQIIVSIPDATSFDALPAEMKELFGLLGIVSVPDWKMPGTRVFSGRRLTHLMSTATPATIEWLLAMLDATSGSDWHVEAAQDWELERDVDGNITGGVYRPVPLSLLDYVEDQFDEAGNALPRPTAPVPLHTFSGAEQWVWA